MDYARRELSDLYNRGLVWVKRNSLAALSDRVVVVASCSGENPISAFNIERIQPRQLVDNFFAGQSKVAEVREYIQPPGIDRSEYVIAHTPPPVLPFE